MRTLMPTPLTKTILNRWTHATPVHAASGRWVSYLSINAAAVRAGPVRAAAVRDAAVRAAARLDAQQPDQKSDEAAA